MAATQYARVLRDFDWPRLVKMAGDSPCSVHDCVRQTMAGDSPRHSVYLGSVLGLSPSGKYYTAFANGNVTKAEAKRDEAWYAAMDSAAEKYGGSIESGEGDPCDLYLSLPCPRQKPATVATVATVASTADGASS